MNEQDTRSVWMRPSFVLSLVLVAIIAIAALVLVIIQGRGPAKEPVDSVDAIVATTTASEQPGQAASSSAVPPPLADSLSPAPQGTPQDSEDPDPSICGLSGFEPAGPLTTTPKVDEWAYNGTLPYPVSSQHGPGATSPEGFRYCFQHTPQGSLFAMANWWGVTDEARAAWAQYFVSDGEYREKLVSEFTQGKIESDQGRARIVGFRILEYKDNLSRVDLAVEIANVSETRHMAFSYDLVWSEGDWKLRSDIDSPYSQADLANLSSYIPFSD